MKPHHRIYLYRTIVAVFALYGAYCAIPKPTPDPCVTITHIGTDSFGERYTVQGGSWSGYMVTDRPVWIRGECMVEVLP